MKRPEQLLQQKVVRFLDHALPGLLYFHVPNGGARSRVEGAIFKTMGVKAGVADLVLILPNGLAGFLELKAGKGKLTESQESFRDRALKLGCLWAEARSLEDVETILTNWFQPFGWALQARIAA